MPKTPPAGAPRKRTTRRTPRPAAADDATSLRLTGADLDALRRVGTDRFVTVEGVTGLFTPLARTTDGEMTSDERKNLLRIIDSLKKEVASQRSEILRLEAELAALRERPSAPEDFASGVQGSLDELQQRLATMHNALSNFAVRELKLDASVFVQVTPVGGIEYRFVQPGQDIEAAAVSRLSLEVVPVPKSDLAGVWTPNLFQPEVSVSALPEVTTDLAARLEGAGLYSVGEFSQVATRARAQAYLEALLGKDRKVLAQWAQQAALLTLRGVNGAAALVLLRAGLGSFDALAAATATGVRKAYMATRKKFPELKAPAIDEAMAAQWVRAASQYLGLPEPAAPGSREAG